MAVALIEGFDHYASAATGDGSVSSAWTFTATAGITFVTGLLDGSGRALNFATSGGNHKARRTIGGSSDTVTFCFRFKTPATWANNLLCIFSNGSSDQCWIETNSSGTLTAKMGTSANTALGTVLDSTSVALATNSVYFIEVKLKVHNSTGTVGIWVDETNIMSLTGQDTQANGSATITTVGFGDYHVAGQTWAFDDVYVLGSSGDSRLGDRRVISLLPEADTAQADWNLSTGSDGFALIDDDQANSTDYIEAASNSDYSLFDLADLSYVPATIAAIAIVVCAKKTDAGSMTIVTKQKSGATTTDGTTINLGSNFVHYSEIFVQNADTSADWTASDINGLQIGVERTT